MGCAHHRRSELASYMESGPLHRYHEWSVRDPMVRVSERCFRRFWRGKLDDERLDAFDDGLFQQVESRVRGKL